VGGKKNEKKKHGGRYEAVVVGLVDEQTRLVVCRLQSLLSAVIVVVVVLFLLQLLSKVWILGFKDRGVRKSWSMRKWRKQEEEDME
jgi:uncharacterized membrane protein YqjE